MNDLLKENVSPDSVNNFSRYGNATCASDIFFVTKMAGQKRLSSTMRIYHRYLGFFLAGIMAVYAISGIVLIFRDRDLFKKEIQVERQLELSLSAEKLGQTLRIRDLKVKSEMGNIISFKEGNYNKTTGTANYKTKRLPFVLEKLTQLHKANTRQPLFYLNIFLDCHYSSSWCPLSGCSCLRQPSSEKGCILPLRGWC